MPQHHPTRNDVVLLFRHADSHITDRTRGLTFSPLVVAASASAIGSHSSRRLRRAPVHRVGSDRSSETRHVKIDQSPASTSQQESTEIEPNMQPAREGSVCGSLMIWLVRQSHQANWCRFWWTPVMARRWEKSNGQGCRQTSSYLAQWRC